MIIDDTPTSLGRLVDILCAQGYEVCVLTNGNQALKHAQQNTPDLILLEINLSGMNAYDIFDKLKMSPALKNVPVICLSSHNESNDKIKALECGAVEYIAKPFEAEEVRARIETHLKLAKAEILEKQISKITDIEKQYYAELDCLADAIIHVNQQGKIVYCNLMVEKYFGYRLDELLGRTIEILIPGDYKKNHISKRQKYTKAPITRSMSAVKNLVGQKKNGEIFQVEISLSALPSESGVLTFVEIRDISEQVRLTKELDRQRQFVNDAFSKITDGLLITNITGKIIDSNPAIEKLFGYSRDELVGKQTQFLYDSEAEYQKVLLHLATLTDELDRTPSIVTCRRKDMTTFIAEVITVQEKDNAGQHDGCFCIIRDISGRLLMEQEHKFLVKQLLQAQKMEALGQLTGGVAHDFNNILASMMGFTELSMDLVEQELDAPSQDVKLKLLEYMSEVQDSGKRAQSLISQMLTFSRSGTSGEQEPFDMKILVHEAMKLLRPVLPASINILSNMQNHNMLVLVDSVQLHQVVMNVCINARDAMNGKGDIIISLEKIRISEGICTSCHQSITGEYLELAIRDSGPGIMDCIMERLFEPFFTTKKAGKGTGMGLAMAHGIMHRHNGHIVVNTELGKGTTFRLLLPLHTEIVEAESNEPAEVLDELS